MRFRDRKEAGQHLAEKLSAYRNQSNVLVLALPRGGVPVAVEVARALDAPLDVFLVRKLGVPGHEELALGAVATGGVRVLNHLVMRNAQITQDELDEVTERELKELERREQVYRGSRPLPKIHNRTIILVDDGLATGATMRAAVLALREQNPAYLVVGVPIASSETCDEFRDQVDEIVCAVTPEPFYAVGLWYQDFSQLTDDDVQSMLAGVQQGS